MSRQWQFTQDDQRQWRWMSTDADAAPIESSKSFPDQTRCMIDAVRFAVQRRRAQVELDGSGNEPGAQPH